MSGRAITFPPLTMNRVEAGGGMDRRSFLGCIAGAVATLGAGGRLASRPAFARPIGIQLYTVRELMRGDPERTLAALAEIGYAEVELAGLHGHGARELRAMLDRTGLAAPAGHVSLADIRTALDRTLEDAATLGHGWIVVPWVDAPERTHEGYERLAGLFDETGAVARRAGLRLAYHNQAYDLHRVDGVVPYELLLTRTDPALVDFEMDLYWIRDGGGEAIEWLTRHPGRFPMVHVKDMDAAGRMVDVGAGVIDFAAVAAESRRAGIRHWFVEHDEPPAPLDHARASYRALRRILS